MNDAVLFLLGTLLVLGLVVAFILTILALTQIGGLNRRVTSLQRQIRELWDELPPLETERKSPKTAKPRPAEHAHDMPPLVVASAESPQDVVPVIEEAPPDEPSPGPSARKKKPPHRRPAATEWDWSRVEAWLGLRGLGWAAGVLLVITAGFFLQHLIERHIIGPLVRVIIGVVVGVLLCSAGWFYQRRRQQLFCQMLTAPGVAILYLATFATFGYYQFLTRDQAAPFLLLIVVEALALAVFYDAPAIGIMAVCGGLLTPVLLHSDQDLYIQLFSYLAVLNAGVILLSLIRRWPIVTTLSLVGTQILFWSWYDENYFRPPATSKFWAAILLQKGILAMYLLQVLLVHVWQKRRAGIEDLIRLVVLSLLFSLAAYRLLEPDYHPWMGTFAVWLAIIFAVLAWIVYRRRPEDELLLFSLLALSMAGVAAVVPLQADANWIALGWAVQGLALWWFGLRIRARPLYGMGAVFLVCALIRLLFVDTAWGRVHDDPFVPLFNRYGLPAALVSASAILAAGLQRRTRPDPDSPDFIVMRVMGVAGVMALLIVSSVETYDFFVVRGNLYSPGVQALLTPAEREMRSVDLEQLFVARAEHLRWMAQMSLSALWAVFALALLALGLRLDHQLLRWLALVLFAVTLIKVMIVDTERLTGMYRVGAFFALSLMMGVGAWAYQKVRQALLPPHPTLSPGERGRGEGDVENAT